MNRYRLGCWITAIFVFLFISGCGIITKDHALDSANLAADTAILVDSYETTSTIVHNKLPEFDKGKQEIYLEFDDTVRYLISRYSELSSMADISPEEIESLWEEVKESYMVVRAAIHEDEHIFKKSEYMSLESFDFKAQEADKSVKAFLSHGDANSTLAEIASIIGMTLKIITVTAAL